MIEIPGRLGNIYRRFEPGEIIAPPDSPEKRADFYARGDLTDIYGDWDSYVARHTWVVVGMGVNDVSIHVRRFGEEATCQVFGSNDSVLSESYTLATKEQVAQAVVRRIRGKPKPFEYVITKSDMSVALDFYEKGEWPVSEALRIICADPNMYRAGMTIQISRPRA